MLQISVKLIVKSDTLGLYKYKQIILHMLRTKGINYEILKKKKFENMMKFWQFFKILKKKQF